MLVDSLVCSALSLAATASHYRVSINLYIIVCRTYSSERYSLTIFQVFDAALLRNRPAVQTTRPYLASPRHPESEFLRIPGRGPLLCKLVDIRQCITMTLRYSWSEQIDRGPNVIFARIVRTKDLQSIKT